MLEIRGIWLCHMSRWDRYVLRPRIWVETSRSGTVPHIGPYTKPLTELLKKNQKFVWTNECDESFTQLKARLTSATFLTLSDIHKGFDIYCDASRRGLDSVLMQDGKVVAYA